MRILHAELEDFRNFERARFAPSRDVTALVGANGQGKTNAIEALYLLSALRPLRPVPRRSLVREGCSRSRIAARVLHASTGLHHDLELGLEGASRSLTRDGKRVPTADFVGSLVAIAFTPDDLQLAKAGPDGRRRFLDRAVLNARPAYLGSALRYAKAMKDRNRLLARQAPDADIDAFDAVLAREGAAITEARSGYVERIAASVADRFRDIAHPAPPLTVRYARTVSDRGQGLAAALLDDLGARRARDRQRATTSVGPHLDDLELRLDGSLAKERASQGQHRALVLALKLVEIEELSRELGEAPILLLDDMSSELDADRTKQLFDTLRILDGQVVLTSTSPAERLVDAVGSARELVAQSVADGRLGPPAAVMIAPAAAPPSRPPGVDPSLGSGGPDSP